MKNDEQQQPISKSGFQGRTGGGRAVSPLQNNINGLTSSLFSSLDTDRQRLGGTGDPRTVAASMSVIPRWRATSAAVDLVAVAVRPRKQLTPYFSRRTCTTQRCSRVPFTSGLGHIHMLSKTHTCSTKFFRNFRHLPKRRNKTINALR